MSHYWLSQDNAAPTYTALPDGCVDIVIEATGSVAQSWIYGTTTRRTDIAVARRRHYLGIRFKPGQSRHFVALPARELTDTHVPTQGLIGFSLDRIAERIASGTVAVELDADVPTQGLIGFSLDRIAERIASGTVAVELDAVLIAWLAKRPPESNKTDAAIRAMSSFQGVERIDAVAARLGISRRQLERLFLDDVGISPKRYAMLGRCHRAMKALSVRSRISLADVALEMGYADQSHMNREFVHLIGETPSRLLRRNVAFIQEILP